MSQASSLPTSTWRWKSGLATWTWRVPRGSEPSNEALQRALLWVVSALGPFARPTKAAWTTESDGEDAVTIELGANPRSDLAAVSIPDPIQVDLDLNLLVTTPQGEQVEIQNGATLWLELEIGTIAIVLSLDVDVYAWRSWGEDRDNTKLAQLNASRLSSFLEDLQRSGAVLLDIDAADYRGQTTAHGFRPPAD